MYIRAGLDKFELEEVSSLAKYIKDELSNLRKAITETIAMENKMVIDAKDNAAVQDKTLSLDSLNVYINKLDTESKHVYAMLATVRDTFKEVQGKAVAEAAPRGGVGAGTNTRLVLKPMDSLWIILPTWLTALSFMSGLRKPKPGPIQ